MSVENVKVKFIRPKYDNLKEWMQDNNNVYIGRGGVVFVDNERYPKEKSVWSNPFKIGKDRNRDEVLDKYEKYIRDLLKKNSKLIEELLMLKGKNLGCWCVPNKCHGHILLKIINELKD